MIAEAQDSSLEKALIRKVQGFFHHSGDRAVAKSVVEHIQCDASACESRRKGELQ